MSPLTYPPLLSLLPHQVSPFVLLLLLLLQHCGEGAFAALKASIDERRRQQLQLDPSILLLGQIELVGETIFCCCCCCCC